jgi:hypothetical protein
MAVILGISRAIDPTLIRNGGVEAKQPGSRLYGRAYAGCTQGAAPISWGRIPSHRQRGRHHLARSVGIKKTNHLFIRPSTFCCSRWR